MKRENLIKFLKCETSEKEELAVLDWLERDSANQRQLDQLDMVFSAAILHNTPVAKNRPINGAIGNMKAMRCAFAVAASLILLLGGGWLFSEYEKQELSEMITEVYVPAGQQISITLQDGSTVWLNAETTLKYPSVFASDCRRVEIDGEAVFEVEHDADKPFVVETFACDVEVLGTKFNVVAYPRQELFSTSLIEGSVRVVNRYDDDFKIVKPNQSVTLVGDKLLLAEMKNRDDFLWLDGVISLKEDSFETLLVKLEKTYNVNIHVQRNELPHLSYKGKVRISDGIEHALNILSFEGEFSYERSLDTNDIYIK